MFLFGRISEIFVFLKRRLWRVTFLVWVAFFMIFCVDNVYALTLKLSDLSESYSGCYFRDNGDGTSTVSTVIRYKEAAGHLGGSILRSRGVLVYSYDKNGRLNTAATPASQVTLNGVKSQGKYTGDDYVIFYGASFVGVWANENVFSASIEAIVRNDLISAWPAVAIRAGNYAGDADIAEINGVAYISKHGANDGACRVVVNPGTPPPPDIIVDVSAPDWGLGDLQRGVSDTRLSLGNEMLCFSYDAAQAQLQKFIVNASSANGMVNNRFRLQHLTDNSQVVPYSLMLDSGSTRIQLPGNNSPITLDGSGRTCFSPTFTTEVSKAVKEGGYSDVLTFTITTNS